MSEIGPTPSPDSSNVEQFTAEELHAYEALKSKKEKLTEWLANLGEDETELRESYKNTIDEYDRQAEELLNGKQ